MLHIEVDTAGAEADLRRLSSDLDREMQRALRLAGRMVEDEAKKRSPISPTKAQARGTGYHYDSKKAPGTLTNSIGIKMGRDYVDVGVMSGNARKYAEKIHDGKYKLGSGSKAKGAGVGPKFLDRAYEENEGKVRGVFEKRANAAVARVA